MTTTTTTTRKRLLSHLPVFVVGGRRPVLVGVHHLQGDRWQGAPRVRRGHAAIGVRGQQHQLLRLAGLFYCRCARGTEVKERKRRVETAFT